MDVSVFSDPIKFGPGIWFKMHIDAVEATTDNLKIAFEINIHALCDNFKCKKCQTHFRKFLDKYPLRNYWNIYDDDGKDIGFFKWTWEFHNAVNKYLRKYQPSLKEAYAFYSSPEVGTCTKCGVNKQKDDIEPRSRGIPEILTLYRNSNRIKPQPFNFSSKSNF